MTERGKTLNNNNRSNNNNNNKHNNNYNNNIVKHFSYMIFQQSSGKLMKLMDELGCGGGSVQGRHVAYTQCGMEWQQIARQIKQ